MEKNRSFSWMEKISGIIGVLFHPWTSTPGPADHPRQRGTLGMRFRAFPFLSPFGGGRGRMGNEETGDRRRFQTVPSNVQNIHPRSAEADHPRQRWTVGMRFRAFIPRPFAFRLCPLSFAPPPPAWDIRDAFKQTVSFSGMRRCCPGCRGFPAEVRHRLFLC